MRRTLEVLNDLEKQGSSAASLDDFVSCYLGCSRRPAGDEERLSQRGGYSGNRHERIVILVVAALLRSAPDASHREAATAEAATKRAKFANARTRIRQVAAATAPQT